MLLVKNSRSLEAFSNLKKICETHLSNNCKIEVIDLKENPEMAGEHQILALPTTVRTLPRPIKKIIWDQRRKSTEGT